jgi:hypothetical protein
MGYLTTADLKRVIQTANLNDIVGNDTTMITYAEQAAITEAKSYLSPKYDTSAEFRNVPTYLATGTYYFGDTILMDAPTYQTTKNYAYLETATYQGNVYYRIDPYTTYTPGPFDPLFWQLVAPAGTIWTPKAPTPYTVYNENAYYKANDYIIMLNSERYKCLTPTLEISQQYAMQFYVKENVPPMNQTPSQTSGQKQWMYQNTYFVSGGQIWLDKMDNRDNRNQQLVNYIIDIMLYHLHARISPRNIPELRLERYDNAKAWLTQCAKGDEINAGLPRLTPQQGMRIRWGGGVKQNFTY